MRHIILIFIMTIQLHYKKNGNWKSGTHQQNDSII